MKAPLNVKRQDILKKKFQFLITSEDNKLTNWHGDCASKARAEQAAQHCEETDAVIIQPLWPVEQGLLQAYAPKSLVTSARPIQENIYKNSVKPPTNLMGVFQFWRRHIPNSPHGLQRWFVEERGLPVNHFNDHNTKRPNINFGAVRQP